MKVEKTVKTMLDVKKFIEKEAKYLDNAKIRVTRWCHFDYDLGLQCLDVDVEIWDGEEYIEAINVYSTDWVNENFDTTDLSLLKKEFVATSNYVQKHFDYRYNVEIDNNILLP